jgi:YD repeat-containing protein
MFQHRHARSVAFMCVALSAGCGGSSSNNNGGSAGNPVGPSTQTVCRTYPTTATVTTTIGATTQVFALTGTFNTSARTSTVTTTSQTGALCTTSVNTYSSVADFVDEVRVIPGVSLQTTTTTTNGPACGTGTQTVTYTYDAQRRLTSFASSAGGSATTYTAWDGSGRPTAGGFPGTTISNVYDDTARTLAQSQTPTSGGVSTTTVTYDANGNQIQSVNKSGNVTVTTTYANTATAQVCK